MSNSDLNLSPDTPLTPMEAAAYLGVTRRTLNMWRHLRRGPVYSRIGPNTVRYRVRDLDAFVAARVHKPRS